LVPQVLNYGLAGLIIKVGKNLNTSPMNHHPFILHVVRNHDKDKKVLHGPYFMGSYQFNK
jgi:hypothetical protein